MIIIRNIFFLLIYSFFFSSLKTKDNIIYEYEECKRTIIVKTNYQIALKVGDCTF